MSWWLPSAPTPSSSSSRLTHTPLPVSLPSPGASREGIPEPWPLQRVHQRENGERQTESQCFGFRALCSLALPTASQLCIKQLICSHYQAHVNRSWGFQSCRDCSCFWQVKTKDTVRDVFSPRGPPAEMSNPLKPVRVALHSWQVDGIWLMQIKWQLMGIMPKWDFVLHLKYWPQNHQMWKKDVFVLFNPQSA